MILTPSQLNIPHDAWRPGQYEAIEYLNKSKARVTLLDAVTGSGKTALGLGLGSRGKKVRTLTFTKALQAQYGTYPSVEVLYGLGNYPCDLLGDMFQADSCVFPHDMMKCPSAAAGACAYVNQREKTKQANRQALSYQYFFKAVWPFKNGAEVDHLYGDEAHHLPQAIMSHMTFEMQPNILSRYRLPPIPSMPDIQSIRLNLTKFWLESVIDVLTEEILYFEMLNNKSVNHMLKQKAMMTLKSDATAILTAMDDYPDEFYVHLTDLGVIQIVPLTPAPFFWDVFRVPEETHITLASATIGNHAEFAKLLGIGKDYDSHVVPAVYPPESQPVFYYEDAPKIGYSSSSAAYRKQADLMKSIIGQFPNRTNGLIHFVSIQAAKKFAGLLSSEYGNRLWMPNVKHSTEQKLAAWEHIKQKRPGTICLAWSFHTGVDAPDVDFNIVQKIPFLPLDVVGKQLMKRNGRLYGWLAGINTEQACGRIRRGEPEHYEEPGRPKRKHVAILDNNFRIVRKYFSNHFKDCLVKV